MFYRTLHSFIICVAFSLNLFGQCSLSGEYSLRTSNNKDLCTIVVGDTLIIDPCNGEGNCIILKNKTFSRLKGKSNNLSNICEGGPVKFKWKIKEIMCFGNRISKILLRNRNQRTSTIKLPGIKIWTSDNGWEKFTVIKVRRK